jgi:hypothetical protein
MLSRRPLRALLPAVVLLLAGAQPAAAGLALSTTVTPQTVRSPAKIAYGLKMVNDGDAQERFSVALVSPTYRAPFGEALAESNAIRQLGNAVIDGPATLLGGFTHVAGLLPVCSSVGAGGHGYGLESVSFDVGVPPRSTSTLRATYEAGLALWPDLDLRLRFVLGARLTTGRPGTLAAARKVLSPQPAIAGRVAMHLTFSTSPASGLASFDGRRPIARGTPVAIAGRANPALPGERIELRWARVDGAGKVLRRGRAARPRIGAGGRFRARWTPPGPGSYELWARYDSHRRDVVSDDTCPRLLRVKHASTG